MATHNIEDGTGGLDGSIVYEQDRAEVPSSFLLSCVLTDRTCVNSKNGGTGIFNSLRHLTLGISRHVGGM